ncbi:MAG: hypothetical protein RMJ75_06215 [Nitrososphaerota archaeon]|nr:hypothetical protein [Nitrososphaerota archaeon]
MLDFEAIVERIRERFGEDAARQVLERVEAEISRDAKLTRLGALLLVAGELGYLGKAGDEQALLRLGNLVGGLRGITVTCRVIGFRGPLEASGKKVAYMRVGDGSAKTDVVAWGEAADALGRAPLNFGDAVRLVNVRVTERAEGGVDLHLDERSGIERVDAPWLPPAEELFSRSLGTVGRDVLDIEACVVGLGQSRSIVRSGKTTGARSALVLMGRVPVLLSVREDHLTETPLEPWTVYRFTSLRMREGRLITTVRSCASRSGGLDPKEALGPVKAMGTAERGYALATNGRFWMRLVGNVPKQGEVVTLRSARFEERRRAWVLVVEDYERADSEPEEPPDAPLESLEEGMREISIRGRIIGKSAVSEVRTAIERVKTMVFWLTDGRRSVLCRAWREICDAIEGIPDGSDVRLIFVRVSRSRWGELEVHVDPESEVEALQGGLASMSPKLSK